MDKETAEVLERVRQIALDKVAESINRTIAHYNDNETRLQRSYGEIYNTLEIYRNTGYIPSGSRLVTD